MRGFRVKDEGDQASSGSDPDRTSRVSGAAAHARARERCRAAAQCSHR